MAVWLERWARERPGLLDAGLAVALAATVGSVSVIVAVASLPAPVDAAMVVGIGAAHLAVVWRRTRPGVALAVGCGAFGVQAVASGLFVVLPAALVFPVLLHSFSAHGGRRAPAVALAVGVVAAGVAAARFLTDPAVRGSGVSPPAPLLVGLLLAVVLVGWSLGVVARTRRSNAELLQDRALRAERDRIARETHDIVAHSLAVIINQAKGGRYVVHTEPEIAAETLRVVEETGRRALSDMRGLLGVLRTGEPDGRNPQPGLRDLPELLARVRTTGLRVTCAEHDEPRAVGAATELAAYRVVQEALTNTIRHAGAAAADVQLRWSDDELTVAVSDDGAAPPAGPGGYGLTGLRERVRAVGGTLTAGPRGEGGFAVVARLPVRRTA